MSMAEDALDTLGNFAALARKLWIMALFTAVCVRDAVASTQAVSLMIFVMRKPATAPVFLARPTMIEIPGGSRSMRHEASKSAWVNGRFQPVLRERSFHAVRHSSNVPRS